MDKDGYFKAAREAAQKAGRLLEESMDELQEIFFKGSVDLVTNLDDQSQRLIFNHLSDSFPDHDFLAEEGLCKDKGAEFRWIIDPLDGTTNYAHKFPVFCVSIALEWKGEVVLGTIYSPISEEMFHAAKGEGAFLI